MDFDFKVTSERSILDEFHNRGVNVNRNVYSCIANIHQSKEVTS